MQQDLINSRIRTLIIFCFFLLLLIIIRLVFSQLIYGSYFINEGEKNFLRTETIPSSRGNILDRNGKVIVTNRPIINVYWQGTGNRFFSEDQINIKEELEKLFEISIPFETYKETERRYKKKLIIADIPFEQLSNLLELIPNHPNLLLITEYKRYYPYKNYAVHILGYLNRPLSPETFDLHTTNQFGQMGLERLCENLLKGQQGSLLKKINSVGKKIHTVSIHNPLSGSDITTTLDFDLQAICETIFPHNHAGAILVMDPVDGDILALTSRPSFDPELFLSPLSNKSWQALQIQNPFINRALNACYPPGSIFKLVTLSAALEQELITQASVFCCKGYVDFCNRKYSCNRKTGHGYITIAQSIAQSCNDPFFKIGKIIDIDIIAYYARLFGLGNSTTILLPEKHGIIPSKKWKQEIKGEPWWPGETLSVAIGQILTVTPLQIARMIGAIFTGILIKPRILINETIESETCQVTEKTRNFLKKAMKWVVKKGTAKGVTANKNLKIYAKTSTAQTSGKNKRHLGKKFLEHGWFVAYFKFKNQKPLILIILVEHAGSSQVAKRVAQKFLIEYDKCMT